MTGSGRDPAGTDSGVPASGGIPRTSREATPRFVGRGREMAALSSLLDGAVAGAGAVAVLMGEPGIGKTRTARELAAIAAARGARDLWGRCHELPGAPPYWPWLQVLGEILRGADAAALRSWLGADAAAIAQLVPELSEMVPGIAGEPEPWEGPEGRFRLFDGVASFLRRVAGARPLVVVLEDLHWADEGSILLLQFVADQIARSPLLVLATYRDVEMRLAPHFTAVRSALARLRRRVALSGLDRDEVAQLVADLTDGAPDARLAAAMHAATDGNPFFVDEVVHLLLAERGDSALAADDLRALRVPESVRDVIRRRRQRLSAETRRLLEVAAVIGDEFSLPVLQRASGAPHEAVLDGLERAQSLRLVAPRAGGVRRAFAHALVRETIYDDLPQLDRARLHRRVGEALEAGRGDVDAARADELAHHFFQASIAGDPAKAAAYACRAAEEALRRLGYEDAILHYRRALEVLDAAAPPVALRCDVLLGLARAEMQSGDVAAARRSIGRAAQLARDGGLGDRLVRAALAHGAGLGGFWDHEAGTPDAERLRLIEDALAVVGPDDPGSRAQLESRLAISLYWSPESERRAEIAALTRSAFELAERSGDDEVRLEVIAGWHWAEWRPENLAERLAAADATIRLAIATRRRDAELLGRVFRVADLCEDGDLSAADREIATLAAQAQELRQPRYLWWVDVFRASRAMLCGDLAAARLHNRRLLGEQRSTDEATAEHFFQAQRQALAALVGRAPGDGVDVMRQFAERYPMVPTWRCTLARSLLARGDVARARQELDRLAAADFTDIPRDHAWLYAISILSRLCADLGDDRRARLLYDLMLPYTRRNVIASVAVIQTGSASHELGLLAATLDRFDEAAAHFDEALAANARLGARPALAESQAEYARLLLRRGRNDDCGRAARLLADAANTSGELGLVGLAARTAALAAARPATAASPPAGDRDLDATGDEVRAAAARCALRRDGNEWRIEHGERRFRLRAAKGFDYLVRLLGRPGCDVHALELVAEGGPGGAALPATPAPPDPGSAERARINVVRAVGRALQRIAERDPALGDYLASTVRTGLHCRYTPDETRRIEFDL